MNKDSLRIFLAKWKNQLLYSLLPLVMLPLCDVRYVSFPFVGFATLFESILLILISRTNRSQLQKDFSTFMVISIVGLPLTVYLQLAVLPIVLGIFRFLISVYCLLPNRFSFNILFLSFYSFGIVGLNLFNPDLELKELVFIVCLTLLSAVLLITTKRKLHVLTRTLSYKNHRARQKENQIERYKSLSSQEHSLLLPELDYGLRRGYLVSFSPNAIDNLINEFGLETAEREWTRAIHRVKNEFERFVPLTILDGILWTILPGEIPLADLFLQTRNLLKTQSGEFRSLRNKGLPAIRLSASIHRGEFVVMPASLEQRTISIRGPVCAEASSVFQAGWNDPQADHEDLWVHNTLFASLEWIFDGGSYIRRGEWHRPGFIKPDFSLQARGIEPNDAFFARFAEKELDPF